MRKHMRIPSETRELQARYCAFTSAAFQVDDARLDRRHVCRTGSSGIENRVSVCDLSSLFLHSRGKRSESSSIREKFGDARFLQILHRG